MLLYLQGKKTDDGYKRKKLKLSTPIVNTLDMSSDMEIEDMGAGIIQLSKFYETYIYLYSLVNFIHYYIKIENIIETFTENVVENVPVNGHFIPPLPTESIQTPPVPPPELFQSITEDSDSQSQELPSLESVVYLQKINTLLRYFSHAHRLHFFSG